MSGKGRNVLLGIACLSILNVSVLHKVSYSVPSGGVFFSFECNASEEGFQTILIHQDGTQFPLLNWMDKSLTYLGTPEQVCVSSAEVLTSMLRENEGSINGMYLTYGRTSQEESYVCAVIGYEFGCTQENYLFQLDNSSVLDLKSNLSNFTGRELTFLGNPKQDAQRQGFVDLQAWVNALSIDGFDEEGVISAIDDAENIPGFDIETFAVQVTARIITDSGVGSGTILRRFQNGYLVVTSNHVLSDLNSSIQVLTFNGSTHSAQRISSPALSEIDLAVLYFESEDIYPEPPIYMASSYHLDSVYSTGFANWIYLSETSIQDFRQSGLESYRFTTGELAMVLAKPFSGGYTVGYSNRVEQGMSGGPVLDGNGNLIAINGRLQYPIQGSRVYQFSDGTYPSPDLFSRMQSLSWGIPASLLLPFLESIRGEELNRPS